MKTCPSSAGLLSCPCCKHSGLIGLAVGPQPKGCLYKNSPCAESQSQKAETHSRLTGRLNSLSTTATERVGKCVKDQLPYPKPAWKGETCIITLPLLSCINSVSDLKLKTLTMTMTCSDCVVSKQIKALNCKSMLLSFSVHLRT